MPKHPEALPGCEYLQLPLACWISLLGKATWVLKAQPLQSEQLGNCRLSFVFHKNPLALMLQINCKVIMTIKECGIEPNLKSEHKQHSAQLKEKQMFLILHQAVQQAAPSREFETCTIWPPTRQVFYLLLHTKAHPGSSRIQQRHLSALWFVTHVTGAAGDALYSLVSLLAVCVPAAAWRALSSPSHIKSSNTNTWVLQVTQLCTITKVCLGCSLTFLLPCPKLASACLRIKIWETGTTSHSVGGWL